MGSIDLHREQIIATDAHRPRAVELAHHTAFTFKGGVAGIITRAGIRLAALIDALGQMRGSETTDGLHLAKQIIDHVAPVAEHVHDDAAAVFLAVVP